jgi:hypothetical protein
MAAAKDIKELVADLLIKLENEGIHGVWARFTETPDVVVIPDYDGSWEVAFSRGRILIKMTLDKDYNVTSIKVRYD